MSEELDAKGLEAAREAYNRSSSHEASHFGLPDAIRTYLSTRSTPTGEEVEEPSIKVSVERLADLICLWAIDNPSVEGSIYKGTYSQDIYAVLHELLFIRRAAALRLSASKQEGWRDLLVRASMHLEEWPGSDDSVQYEKALAIAAEIDRAIDFRPLPAAPVQEG